MGPVNSLTAKNFNTGINNKSIRASLVSLVITADPDIVSAPTDVTYTYTVTNISDEGESLTGIEVTDINFGPINLESDALMPSESTFGTVIYPVTQEDIDAGVDIGTSASVSSLELATDEDDVSVAIIQDASVLIVKTADKTSVSSAEENITYTFEVTNDGNITLSDITVTDDKLGNILLDATTLLPGAIADGSVEYDVTQSDINSGNSIVNVATVSTAEGATGTTEPVSVTVSQDVSVAIIKTANKTSVTSAGETINYTYEVTNNGNTSLSEIAVSDDKLGTITMDDTALAPGGTTTGTDTYTVTQSDINLGNAIVNIATVDSAEGASDTDEASVTVSQAASVEIIKTANKTSVSSAGEIINYTYEVTNNGNTSLSEIAVSDDKLGTITMDDTALAPGVTTEGTDTYTVTQSDINSGIAIVNIATVDSAEGASDTDEASVAVSQAASVEIIKTANKTSVTSAGETINYTYEVTNNGNTSLSEIAVSDDKLGTITMDNTALAPGETTTGTDTYTVTQSDINSGNAIVNIVTVDTAEGASDTDEASVAVSQAASVEIVKTADKTSVTSAGDVITYTYEVSNNGNTSLSNISVSDDKLGTITMDDTTLAPGETTEGTDSYTVAQSDINSGSAIVNVATVTTEEGVSDTDNASVAVSQDASVEIVKTADKTSVTLAGDIITYTYEVINNGNTSLSNVAVSDDKLGTITMDDTTLAPGETTEGTDTYTVTQSDINSGSAIVNVATVTTEEGVSDTDDASVAVSQDASVEIVKAADKTSVTSAGDVITYTYEVTNNGNTSLSNVAVSDDKLGTITMDDTTLAPGETTEGTDTYTVTQSDINAGSAIVNVATVTTAEGVSDTDEVTVTINQQSDLVISKTASPTTYSSVGQEIDFTITVENTGNVTLSNITVSDPLIDLSETISNLVPEGTQTFTETYIITQADLDEGSLTNTATASDGNSINVSDNVTITAAQTPGISLTKTASPVNYNSVGDVITYTFFIENTGNVVLTGVTVSDQLLNLDESIGNLEAGESVSIEESYSITQVDLNNGSLSNTAFVTGNDPEGQEVSDSDEVTVSASQNPNLAVRKTASPLTYDSVGDEITYTIEVENTGNVALISVVVTDELIGLSESIVILAPGETRTYTESFNINQSHLNSGSVTNTVSVTGIGSLSIVVNDTDDATVTAVQRPALSVSKTSVQENYKAVGDEISYTIVTENTGNVTITNVNVNDPLVQLDENIGSLNPGDSHSISVVYSVSQADLDEGIVINTVDVTGNLGNESVEADDEAVVTALFPPVANDDTSSDHISGNSVEIAILENDVLNDGTAALPGLVTVDLNLEAGGIQSELIIQDEGEWNYNLQSGVLTFTPQSGFTTDPSPITYQLTENSTDLSDDASVTVDYNEGEPFAFNDNSTGNKPGEPVTINIVENDKLSDGSPASPGAVTIDIDISQAGVQTIYSVPGEGEWVFNVETGEVVFTPLPGFSTNPAPLIYNLTENQTELSDDGTVIVGYDEQPPAAVDDISTGNTPGDAVTVNILVNDSLGDGTQAIPELVVIDIDLDRAGVQDELNVSGEGTWNLDASTGDITFTPLPGFSGSTEPVTYRLLEILTGLSDNATITIVYNDEAPVAVDDSSSGNQPGTEVTLNILDNDVLNDGTPASPDLVTVDIDPLAEGLQHELTIGGQGTWMYNAVNGNMIFTPQSGFFADPSPVSYTLCSIWDSEFCSEAEVMVDYDQGASSASIALVKTGIFNSDDETIDYSFEVTNTGNLPVWNIEINDELIGVSNLRINPDTLHPGDAGTVNTTYQVTLLDKNTGSVTNSAMAAGLIVNGERIEDISGGTVNDDDPTVTPLIQAPSILVEKQAVLFTPEAVLNEAVDFSIILTNNGNVILNDVRVEDPLTGFTQNVGQLIPGNSMEYTTVYVVQPEDELSGEFENTAVVTGIAPDGSEVSDSSSVVVQVEQCEMVIPNGFSPNDDGIQDTWQIKCLEKYPNARVEIFNRWGNRVYEKRNYGNTDVHGMADAWWDGYSTSQRTFGSGKLPAGTYYYILYLQDGQEPVNGYIFLNR